MEEPTDGRDGALDPLELRAWRGLIETTALLRRRSDQLLLADSGLSGSDYPVLVTLHELGDATVRSTELAERIGWEQSRLSHHLARMERRGLVGRRRHEPDNRGSEVFITDEGRSVFLAAAKAHSQTVRTLFADVLSRQQLAALADAMETLARNLTVPGAGTTEG
ncbi:MarR family winged helix-turn-helix transcriptional regulator [Microlunatus spumicola]|uniref:MarR family winged helix-turn-helix transcriptional regulator n=1 Tax=Microlunatus spumicola TaxID=81499 RepID=A0ABP6X8J7_9ACTN